MPRRALALLCLLPTAAAQDHHADPSRGFRVKVPGGFERWPVEKDRRFVHGLWVYKQSFPLKGSEWGHRPAMRVIVLPRKGPPADPPPAAVEFYAGYEDYLVRNVSGKVTVTAREPVELEGVSGTRLDVERRLDEQLYRITTLLVAVGDDDVAVEFHVHESAATKVRAPVQASLKSFRLVDRDGTRPADPYEPPPWERDPAAWRAKPAGVRISARGDWEQAFFRAIEAEPLHGFKAKKTASFLILSNASTKYTDDVAQGAEAARRFCVGHFDRISDEVVLRAVIRVFEQRQDYDLYRSRAAGGEGGRFAAPDRDHYVPAIREIVVYVPGPQPRERTGLDNLHRGIVQQFLRDKDRDLHHNAPAWLRDGIHQYLRQTRLIRSELVFDVSDYEKNVVREGQRDGSLGTVAGLIEQTVQVAEDDEWRLRFQRGRLVRFALASKGVFPEDFLQDYLIAARVAAGQHPRPVQNPGAGTVQGQDAAQREALAKADAEARQKLLAAVNAAVCGFPADRWAAIEKAWDKFNQDL